MSDQREVEQCPGSLKSMARIELPTFELAGPQVLCTECGCRVLCIPDRNSRRARANPHWRYVNVTVLDP